MKNTHLSGPRSMRDCVFTYGSTSEPVAKVPGYGVVWWLAVCACCAAAAVVIVLSEQAPL